MNKEQGEYEQRYVALFEHGFGAYMFDKHKDKIDETQFLFVLWLMHLCLGSEGWKYGLQACFVVCFF